MIPIYALYNNIIIKDLHTLFFIVLRFKMIINKSYVLPPSDRCEFSFNSNLVLFLDTPYFNQHR